MWPEPLIPASEDDASDPKRFRTVVRAGDRTVAVAALEVIISPRARFATCGELTILDATGAPQQRVRALVLLMREALRRAAELNIQHVYADVPDRLRDFLFRCFGIDTDLLPSRRDGWRAMEIDLATLRSLLLDRSDANGNL